MKLERNDPFYSIEIEKEREMDKLSLSRVIHKTPRVQFHSNLIH